MSQKSVLKLECRLEMRNAEEKKKQVGRMAIRVGHESSACLPLKTLKF